MGNWAAWASPAIWARARVSRGMPWLKTRRASGPDCFSSSVWKPMNCRMVVGWLAVSYCPATAERSSVGSTVSSSVRREEKRYMAEERSLAWTSRIFCTGRALCCHQSGLAIRQSSPSSPAENK